MTYIPLGLIKMNVVCEFNKSWKAFCHPTYLTQETQSWPFYKKVPSFLNRVLIP